MKLVLVLYCLLLCSILRADPDYNSIRGGLALEKAKRASTKPLSQEESLRQNKTFRDSFILDRLASSDVDKTNEALKAFATYFDEIKSDPAEYKQIRQAIMQNVATLEPKTVSAWTAVLRHLDDLSDEEFLKFISLIRASQVEEERRNYHWSQSEEAFPIVIKALGDNSYERVLDLAGKNQWIQVEIEENPIGWMAPTFHPEAAVTMFEFIKPMNSQKAAIVYIGISRITPIVVYGILDTSIESKYATFVGEYFGFLNQIYDDASFRDEIRLDALKFMLYMGAENSELAGKALDITTSSVDYWQSQAKGKDIDLALAELIKTDKARSQLVSNPNALASHRSRKAAQAKIIHNFGN